MKKTTIQSFLLYTDVRPVLDLVPPEDGLQLLKTIFDYAAGEDVEPFQNIITEKIWEMIRQKLEVGREKAIRRSETNRQNVKARWDKESNTTVYDGIQKDSTVFDSKNSYTKGATEQNSTVQYCDCTEQSQVHVQVQNKDNTESTADFVSDPAGGSPARAAAADAAPRPAPDSDLFTIDQLKRCIKKNKVDLTDEGAEAFLDEMHENGWTLYSKPVEKKTITRTLRAWAKYHGEYSAADPEDQEEEAQAAEKAERIRQRKEEEDKEKAEQFSEFVKMARNVSCRRGNNISMAINYHLRNSMIQDGIPEYAVMAFSRMLGKQYVSTKVEDYDPDYTAYLMDNWNFVRDTIRKYAKYAEVAGVEF